MKPPDLSILLVNYNTAHLLEELFASLHAASAGLAVEIILLDNSSSDNSVGWMRAHHPEVPLIENRHNVGFGRANNQCLPHAHGRYLLLLNTDAFMQADSLHKTLDYMQTHPQCGILGVRLIGRDGRLQPSCRYFPNPWNLFLSRSGLDRWIKGVRLVDDMEWDHNSPRQCDWVPGCFYLLRSELVQQVGLFDPRYFLYYEEVDHCRTAKRAGWQVHFCPDTSVVHLGGESAKSEGELTSEGSQLGALQLESELLYMRKQYGSGGLLLHLWLQLLVEMLRPLKRWLKRRSPMGWRQAWQNIRRMTDLLRNTHWATRPTR